MFLLRWTVLEILLYHLKVGTKNCNLGKQAPRPSDSCWFSECLGGKRKKSRVQEACLKKNPNIQMQKSENPNHLCCSHKEVSMPIRVKLSVLWKKCFGGNVFIWWDLVVWGLLLCTLAPSCGIQSVWLRKSKVKRVSWRGKAVVEITIVILLLHHAEKIFQEFW